MIVRVDQMANNFLPSTLVDTISSYPSSPDFFFLSPLDVVSNLDREYDGSNQPSVVCK